MLKNVRLPRRFIAAVTLLGAISLAGCGSEESGIAGYYDVVSHTRNATSCDSPGPEVPSSSTGDDDSSFPDYVRLDDVHFRGSTGIRGRGCAGIADNSCNGFISFEFAFGLGPVDDGWGSDAVTAPTGSKAECTFTHSSTRVRSIDDKTVEIRMEHRMGSRAVESCDLDHELHIEGRTLPCQSLETITLRKR